MAAESDASKFASPGVKSKVDSAVHRKFPEMGAGLLGKRKSAAKKKEEPKSDGPKGAALLGMRR